MDTGFSDHTSGSRPETEAERADRVRWEAEIIARSRAEAAAGLVIEFDALEIWLAALEDDPNAPLPEPLSSAQRS